MPNLNDKEVKCISQVMTQVDYINGEISILHDRLTKLSLKLDKVLTVSEPIDKVSSLSDDKSTLVPLASDLSVFVYSIQNANHMVEDITDRLEI